MALQIQQRISSTITRKYIQREEWNGMKIRNAFYLRQYSTEIKMNVKCCDLQCAKINNYTTQYTDFESTRNANRSKIKSKQKYTVLIREMCRRYRVMDYHTHIHIYVRSVLSVPQHFACAHLLAYLFLHTKLFAFALIKTNYVNGATL